jgi:hypothetical protein
MSAEVFYKRAELGDNHLTDLVRLHQKHGYANRTDNSFKWLYFSSLKVKSGIAIAVYSNSICGSYGMIFYPLVKNGAVINSFKGEAVLIDEHRRNEVDVVKLFYTILNETKLMRNELSWGMTSNFALIRLIYRQKANSGLINLYLLPIRRGFTRSYFFNHLKLGKSKKRILHVLSPIVILGSKVLFNLSDKRNHKILLTPSDAKTDSIEKFMLDFSKKNPESVFLYPDKDFLNWRLNENPSCSSGCFQVSEGDRVIGYTILNYREDLVEIAELIVESDYFQSVIHAIVKELSFKARIVTIVGNVLNPVFCKHDSRLKQMGFIKKSVKSSFVFKSISDRTKSWALSHQSFYISNIWSEGI